MDALHNRKEPVRLAVLVSGGGTNLQALIDRERAALSEAEPCPYRICAILSDRSEIYALERASAAEIPAEVASAAVVLGSGAAKAASRDEKRRAVSSRIIELAEKHGAEGLVLAGFLTVLTAEAVARFSGRIINLHPSLLPKFGGVGMWGHHVHEAVLAAGETESGCTVHLVDEGCDTGDILLQRRVPVLPGDTAETLARRIAAEEHVAIVQGAEMLAGRIRS